jgi:hypothetical protein
MDRLIEIGLTMPPIVSAMMSLVTVFILIVGGKRILKELEQQSLPILKELAAQSSELRTQSRDLVDIKIQTARTNGRVLALEDSFEAHERLDEEHHVDTKAGLERNRSSIHSIRDQISDFALTVKLQEKRINKRDDELGIGSK